jgi:hypothetical protein
MPTQQGLKAHAVEFLNIWCDEKDISKDAVYLHPLLIAYHDIPAVKVADAFVLGWHSFFELRPSSRRISRKSFRTATRCGYTRAITGVPGGVVKGKQVLRD